MEAITITMSEESIRVIRLTWALQDLDRLTKDWPRARRRWGMGKGNMVKEAMALTQRQIHAATMVRDTIVDSVTEGEGR